MLLRTDRCPMIAINDTPFDAELPTLLQVLDKAVGDQAIPAARVARTRAAVAAFARLMRRPAAELPAHQGFLIHQLRRLRREPTGLSSKTLSNTRSELLNLIRPSAVADH